MNKNIHLLVIIIWALSMASCRQEPTLPQTYKYTKDSLKIFPDYKNIIVPPNIAPLNFQVESNSENILAEVCFGNQTVLIAANSENEIQFDEKKWKDLLKQEHGKGINIHMGQWALVLP